ncbi:MAG TPA: hypothetical protein VK615_07690 [Candidatus Binatia bacterium]|nr:hypothetical protein [Candidatus Binatia bacterium]
MFSRKGLLATIVFLIGLTVVGCGSDSNDSSASASSRTDFVKKANAICQAGSKDIASKAQPILADSGSELARKRKLVDTAVAPVFEREVREIRALEAPPDDVKEVDAILSAMQELVDDLEGDPLSHEPYPYRDTEDLAAGYGLNNCGHP